MEEPKIKQYFLLPNQSFDEFFREIERSHTNTRYLTIASLRCLLKDQEEVLESEMGRTNTQIERGTEDGQKEVLERDIIEIRGQIRKSHEVAQSMERRLIRALKNQRESEESNRAPSTSLTPSDTTPKKANRDEKDRFI